MPSNVNAVPEGYHSVTPYLIVNRGAEAIDFYTNVFGARERMRLPGENGKVGHSELEIGDSVIMLADESPAAGARSPQMVGGSPVGLAVYIPDVDGVVAQAVAAGATLRSPVEDKFYGDRSGTIEDPFGHVWYVMTHIEDVSPDEMERRMKAGANA